MRESERWLRHIYENSPVMMHSIDKENNFFNVNLTWLNEMGYSKDEIIGKKVFSIMTAESADLSKNINLPKFWEDEFLKAAPYKYIKKDGTIIDVLVDAIATADPLGKKISLSVVRDVTEKNRLESELRSSQQMLQLVLDTIPDRVFWKNRDLYYLGCNKRFLADARLEKVEDIIGKNDFQLIWREVADLYRSDDKMVIDSTKPKINYEEPQKREDGTTSWLRTNKIPLTDNDGKIIGVLGTYEDITIEREALDEIHLLADIVESSYDAIASTTLDGIIKSWNKGAEEVYGYSIKEMKGNSIAILIPDNKKSELNHILDGVRQGKGLYRYETHRIRKDKNLINVLLTVSPIFDKLGKIKGASMISLDITDRKKSEEKVVLLNKELTEKNRELEHIIYVTSHDLRSPLVNIQGFSKELELAFNQLQIIFNQAHFKDTDQKLTKAIFEKDIQESLQYISASITKMDLLLKGLLKLSRLGRISLSIKIINMNQLIKDILKTFEFKFQENDIEIQIETLPSCIGDENQINQVFSNLIDNAIKYRQPNIRGLIQIHGSIRGRESLFCVEDNGVGIAPENQFKIFEIFNRLNPKENAGEGLGLTIAKKIIDRHSGKIWVDSTAGKGCKFFVLIPNI
jgi:PAS domain S-box-containing protein